MQSTIWNLQSAMELFWLGYDGLAVHYADIVAVLFYRPDLDARLVRDFGGVPANIRAVVVTSGGRVLPSSWPAEQIRRHWARWRTNRR